MNLEFLETGIVDVMTEHGEHWHTITLENTYESPVVIM